MDKPPQPANDLLAKIEDQIRGVATQAAVAKNNLAAAQDAIANETSKLQQANGSLGTLYWLKGLAEEMAKIPPVEAPDVKELERLRAENKDLEDMVRKYQDSANEAIDAARKQAMSLDDFRKQIDKLPAAPPPRITFDYPAMCEAACGNEHVRLGGPACTICHPTIKRGNEFDDLQIDTAGFLGLKDHIVPGLSADATDTAAPEYDPINGG